VLDNQQLSKAGWITTQKKRPSSSGIKVYICYTNPWKELKTLKVEQQLKDERIFERFETT